MCLGIHFLQWKFSNSGNCKFNQKPTPKTLELVLCRYSLSLSTNHFSPLHPKNPMLHHPCYCTSRKLSVVSSSFLGIKDTTVWTLTLFIYISLLFNIPGIIYSRDQRGKVSQGKSHNLDFRCCGDSDLTTHCRWNGTASESPVVVSFVMFIFVVNKMCPNYKIYQNYWKANFKIFKICE